MPTPEFILISLKFKFNNPCIPHNDRIIRIFKIYKNVQFISLNEWSDNQKGISTIL